MSVVGDNIKRIRMARGILQGDLAERIGKNQRTISNWECGKRSPSPEDVRKLAQVLDVAPAEIIGHNEKADYEYEYIMSDDSMYPDIKQGDTLTVSKSAQPADGDLVVVEIAKNTNAVRRLYKIGQMFSLLAVNPAIKPIHTNTATIKGKVTELRRKL